MAEVEPDYVDAEEWLARRGVPRQPLHVEPAPATPPPPDPGAASPPAVSGAPAAPGDPRPLDASPLASPDTSDVRVREAVTLAVEAPPQPLPSAGPAADGLGEQVAKLVAYARRATGNTPMTEQRLRSRLEERCDVPIAVEQAMQRCRRERLVDDRALGAALIDERRRKGHADARIRQDLFKRGLPRDLIEELLADKPAGDLDAAAFAVAHKRAQHLRHLNTDVAFRRLVGYLARRGHAEAIARKVAREVLFADREQARAAER